MRTSDRGLAAIMVHEGIVPGPYLDGVGVLTWGVGHTAAAGAPYPAKMTPGMPTDVDQAVKEAILCFGRDISKYEAGVNAALLKAGVKDVRQYEYDAMVSFHFNTGGISKASFVTALARGDRKTAAEWIMKWNKPAQIIPRRQEEQRLFREGIYPLGRIPIWKVGTDKRLKGVHSSITSDQALTILKAG